MPWFAGFVILLVAWCLTWGHAAHAKPWRQLKDDRGATVTLQQSPARVVSLLPSLTETVCALNACERLVGVDRWSNWPQSIQGLPKVGGLDDANLELIVALKPDLVLASAASRLSSRLRALGIPVAELEAQTLEDVPRVLNSVGALLGREQEAAQAWSQIQAEMAAAKMRVPQQALGVRVYFEVASAPYAAGESSFIGQLWATLGGRNIVGSNLGPFPKLNPEFVVKADPDLIILAQQDAAKLAQRPGWAGMRAIRQGQICALPAQDYDLLARPGPRLGQAAEVLARCLQAHQRRRGA